MLMQCKAEILLGAIIAGFLWFAFSLNNYKPDPTAQAKVEAWAKEQAHKQSK